MMFQKENPTQNCTRVVKLADDLPVRESSALLPTDPTYGHGKLRDSQLELVINREVGTYTFPGL